MKPLIVFLHIPKTGGSTICRYLEMAYGERYAHLRGDAEVNAVTDWLQYDAIAGHFTAGVVNTIPRETRVFTVLRDPVERLASLYRWWHGHDRDNPLEAIRNVQHMTFDEFLACRDYWKHTQNGMTHQVMHRDSNDFNNPIDLFEASDFLDTCELVGTFDNLAPFIARMATMLDWPFDVGGVHEKRIDVPLEIDADARRRVILDNPLDLALYAYAETLF